MIRPQELEVAIAQNEIVEVDDQSKRQIPYLCALISQMLEVQYTVKGVK